MSHSVYAEIATVPAELDLSVVCSAIYQQLVTELGGELMDIDVTADTGAHAVMINAIGDRGLSSRQLLDMLSEQTFDVEIEDGQALLEIDWIEID